MSVNPASHLASHFVMAFAACAGGDWLQATTSVELKNLGKLLRGMTLIHTDAGAADSLSPPHERALAQALGMTPSTIGAAAVQDGLIPWAALEAKAKPGDGWAVITPCHWAMGREHATLTDPATLALTEADSRTLLDAMQPYFDTEGITLRYQQPTRWLASGDVFASLPTASLDRVMGRNVGMWLPASKAIKLLQNEMQMLLYMHPVNDNRAGQGLRSVNSFWVSGTGAISESFDSETASAQVSLNRDLAPAAFAGDWAAYTQAWAQLDATAIAQLLIQQSSGKAVRIILCGESNAMTFETVQHGFLNKIKSVFSSQRPIDMLKQL